MEIKTISELLQDIELTGVAPRTFGAKVEFLASIEDRTPRGQVDIENVAADLGVPAGKTRRVFHRLDHLSCVSQTPESDTYNVDFDRLELAIDRARWLSEPANSEQISRLHSQPPGQIQMITGSPRDVEGIPDPDITGKLIDMVASATETVTVVNPFFSREGLDLLIEAFVAATSRGVELTLLTRDVHLGTTTNLTDIRRLERKIEADGESGNFRSLEVDKESFPDASLHAKVTVVDRSKAYVGSANLTDQSLLNAVELGLYLEEGPVGRIANYLDQCRDSDLFVEVDL